MTPTDLEILRDALSCLVAYRQQDSPRRELGPYGRNGHSIDSVIDNLMNLVEKFEDAIDMPPHCLRCGEPHEEPNCPYPPSSKNQWKPIPQLQPITNRPVKLKKENWE